jgi:L-fuconolactonase
MRNQTDPVDRSPAIAREGTAQDDRVTAARTQFGRIFPPDQAWLALAQEEEIIAPDIPIVDTHHHLWDRPNFRYLPEEFVNDIKTGHNVIATVYVDCRTMYRSGGPLEMRPVGEVEFAAGVAAAARSGRYGETQLAAGIVGFADLTLGNRARAVLEAQLEAGDGRFRGVRHSAAWDASPVIGNSHTSPHPGLYLSGEFRKGFAQLIELGLSLDAWVFHPQLSDLVDLARTFPRANIITNHMGGPLGYGPYANRRDEVFAGWKRSMTQLAQCDNVSVKLGGVMMRLAAFDYMTMSRPPSSEEIARSWGPYVQTCIELFGADRCMFESNFPVEKMGVGYAALWNAFKRMTAAASETEKQHLFSGTAQRVYRLSSLTYSR